MNDLMFKSWVKAQMFKQSVKDKAHAAKEYLQTEKGGADTIIIAVIIILVVVVVGFVFKDWIFSWFSGLTSQVDTAINQTMDAPPGPPGT